MIEKNQRNQNLNKLSARKEETAEKEGQNSAYNLPTWHFEILKLCVHVGSIENQAKSTAGRTKNHAAILAELQRQRPKFWASQRAEQTHRAVD